MSFSPSREQVHLAGVVVVVVVVAAAAAACGSRAMAMSQRTEPADNDALYADSTVRCVQILG